MTTADERHSDSLRSRAMRLAPLIRTSIRRGEAVTLTGISTTSVGRIYRVFRLIDARQTDTEISGLMPDFGVATVATLRSVYLSTGPEADSETATGWSEQRFLCDHRARLERMVTQLRDSLPNSVAAWPIQWLTGRPEPWTGPVTQSPRLEVENEALFDCLLEHLEKLRLEDRIRALAEAASAAGKSATTIECDLTAGVAGDLPQSLFRAAILYGAQMSESPNQAPPEIEITQHEDGRVYLKTGAYGEWFATAIEAEHPKSIFKQAIEETKSSTHLTSFFEARAHANDELVRLTKLLQVFEAVLLEIGRGQCVACSALQENRSERATLPG